jgi:hypothetical protein
MIARRGQSTDFQKMRPLRPARHASAAADPVNVPMPAPTVLAAITSNPERGFYGFRVRFEEVRTSRLRHHPRLSESADGMFDHFVIAR